MQLKGMDKVREKLPDYPGKKLASIPLKGFLAAFFAYLFLIFLDILPRVLIDIQWLTLIEPVIPIIGSLFIAALAYWLIGCMWNKREKLKAEHGDLAYQKIITRGATGVALIPVIIFQAFTSIRSLPPGPPVNDLTTAFSQSLLPLFGIPSEIDIIFRLAMSGIITLIAMLLVRSAIQTFGIDYMVVLYLYFPEESEIQEHEIYSVLRHPTYLAAFLFGVAALFFRFSVYSIVLCFIAYLVFRIHIVREERELVERFGDGYREYKEKVPALLVRPRNLGVFFRFLRPK